MRRITAFTLLPTAALMLAACSGNEDPPAASAPAATLTTAETTSPATTNGPTPTATAADGSTADVGDALLGTAGDVGGPYGELRDGVWAVGPAGEVEFRVTGPDTLELIGVQPNDGWDVREQEVESDKIDVDFRLGPVDYEIEIEMDDGVLEIEIDQDIDPAQPGTFAVGEAATVGVTAENGELALGDVTLNDGWSEVSRDIESDDIEFDFRRDGDGFFETWEINADLDDGRLDIEVDYEIEGVFAQ